jgi:hypothetical protein
MVQMTHFILVRPGRPSSLATTGAVQALAKLLDELTVEPVVPAERHLARQPTLPGPASHGVGRNAQKLRNLRTGQKL